MPEDAPPVRSITTRTGDDGHTSLLYGQRVPKDHPQIEAVGTLDELNAALGLAKATLPAPGERTFIETLQNDLVALMGEIACAPADTARYAKSNFAKLDEASLERLDSAAAAIESRQPPLAGWATPGANPHAAALDLARTAARRAERRVLALRHSGSAPRALILRYLNRLSDLLWLMAREAEKTQK